MKNSTTIQGNFLNKGIYENKNKQTNKNPKPKTPQLTYVQW